MVIDYKSPKEIRPYPKNAKRHSKEQVQKVAKSIEEFGFKQPIVIDKSGVIIVGHGRYEAALLLGMDKIPCLYAEDLTEEQAAAYRLADNKLNESPWDLQLVLSDLSKLPGSLRELTGFNYDYMAQAGKLSKDALRQKFVVPPFSVLDTRQGYWQDRKNHWDRIIGDNGESREQALSGGDNMVNSINEGVSLLDPVLAEVLSQWFFPKGGAACDPFAGDTMFGYVSATLGNTFTGIELRKEQAELNNARCAKDKLSASYVCDDGQNISKHLKPNSQDFVFSCPPYYDLEVYSDLPNDASNQGTYEEFLGILKKAFSGAIKCLKQNRFAAIVCTDIRDKEGNYRGFPDDIKAIFKENGMGLYNDIVLVNAVGTAALRAGRYMATRKIVRMHQNVLVFYKGDIDGIKDLVFNKTDDEG